MKRFLPLVVMANGTMPAPADPDPILGYHEDFSAS
jgi:hypothetical protein